MASGLSAVLLAGCSSSPSTAPATAASSAAAGSASAPAAGNVDSKTFGADLVAAMVAAKSGRATMSVDTAGATGATAAPGGSDSLSMTMEFAFNAAKQMNMHATGDSGGQPFEMVVVDGISYVKSATPVNGRSWLKLPASAELTNATDPIAMASGFAGATITKVGTDSGLTRYSLSGATGQTGDMDVYLDASGRPAKMVMNSSGVKVNAEYKDWGAAVSLSAPPADQVTDVPTGSPTG